MCWYLECILQNNRHDMSSGIGVVLKTMGRYLFVHAFISLVYLQCLCCGCLRGGEFGLECLSCIGSSTQMPKIFMKHPQAYFGFMKWKNVKSVIGITVNHITTTVSAVPIMGHQLRSNHDSSFTILS